MRWIAHVDMDSFYVAVERRRDPNLIGKPVVVGGTGPRAVVASASYEARRYGVFSAMPMAQARRLCSALVIVEPHFAEYTRLSELIFAGLETLCPVIEQVSIDEAYLDFTGCDRLYSSREASAKAVKEQVRKNSGLTCTVGVSTNKLLAKIASDLAKPDGLLVVPAGEEKRFLSPLSVRKIPGVGAKTAVLLERAGIVTCQDLCLAAPERLKSQLGGYALELRQLAHGLDSREVSNETERKSYGAERTFERDVGDLESLLNLVLELSEELGAALRRDQRRARTIQIKLRYPDFTTHTRAKTLTQPTDSNREIAQWASALLHAHKIEHLPLRLLGVSVRNLEDPSQSQMDLFETHQIRRIEQLKDELRDKFGSHVICSPKTQKT